MNNFDSEKNKSGFGDRSRMKKDFGSYASLIQGLWNYFANQNLIAKEAFHLASRKISLTHEQAYSEIKNFNPKRPLMFAYNEFPVGSSLYLN